MYLQECHPKFYSEEYSHHNNNNYNSEPLYLLRPFPKQELFRFYPTRRESSMLLQKVYGNTLYPLPHIKLNALDPKNVMRRKVVMVTHFYNEEFLMPQFIRNHAPMFDEVILINQWSMDNSLAII